MSLEPSRRDFLRMTGAAGAGLAVHNAHPFAAGAHHEQPGSAEILWYKTPATEARIIQEGLPVGNGRLGGLTGGDPAADFLYVTDGSFWSGDRNDTLQDDGQFPYEGTHFGSYGLLAKVGVKVPAHANVTAYRRQLDLGTGVVSATYQVGKVEYRREVYASHPDDIVVVRLTQSGGGSYTGSVTLDGTHGETTTGADLTGTLSNGRKYAATVVLKSTGGSVDGLSFSGCHELLIIVSAGTDYHATGTDPLATAKKKAATTSSADRLRADHVADYQRLYNRMSIHLGSSTPLQRGLDSWSRLAVRYTDTTTPDPELEAAYIQFGRYLTITGSRDTLPMNLQGKWANSNSLDWFSDYHTDINLEMNYWPTGPGNLDECAEALADYCVSQLPSWTDVTGRLFNDPRNRFRNSSGKIAGWAMAFSTNIDGGSGWWWHPAGNAWLSATLWRHYEYTLDQAYLKKIYPVLKGAAEFWRSRLIPMTVDGKQVLVDDNDWSPEHGPQDAKGITYAQELAWELFREIGAASSALGVDASFAAEIKELQGRLYLPKVSPASGWLEEWMSPDNLGEVTHRHLSPLIGFFPGDRIAADTSPSALLDGVRALLTARGDDSFGWACAWRSLCWSRLKDADRAYKLFLTVLRPSISNGNGTSANFFDMYSQGSYTIFQIDANLGGTTAGLEMVLYSRPGVIELLPALPKAWAAEGRVTGIGARGGFKVDVAWRNGKVTSATIHSVGGTTTEVRAGSWKRTVTLEPGASVTVTPAG
ncbi:glycoside hydrolase N-terminal domain-containing protein [Actinoplanes sp. NPDC051411]|uniref:glycosyl hydrolase family 95 catalytic domain-containing protein n=1 Tax=Actinoplanes sp. NPDC051411 TaxID=3155522 RepID=UPI003416D09C